MEDWAQFPFINSLLIFINIIFYYFLFLANNNKIMKYLRKVLLWNLLAYKKISKKIKIKTTLENYNNNLQTIEQKEKKLI